MTKVVLRGFLSRKLRGLLTGVAIALGVALMAGTYILTDTIDHSFAGIFTTANQGHDVVITRHQALGSTASVETAPIPESTLARVRSVTGVAQAAGSAGDSATLLSAAGKTLNAKGFSLVASVVPKRFESFTPVQGRLPTSAGEVAVDQTTASRYSLKLGDTMQVADAAPARLYKIVGIVKFGGSQSTGAFGAAVLTLAEAQRVTGEVGGFDQIDVAATPGVTPGQLRARIRAVLPRALDVRTGAQEAAQQTSDLESQLGFLRTFLLIFAYVSLFVGAFIIFNTFSITVAQRTREFGLLRTLGATRWQLLRSVLFEGVLLGLGGSVLGLAAGIGVAPGLAGLFKLLGASVPDNGTVLELRTVWVSLLVGTVVTVLAGLVPALRSMRVPPIAALREGVSLSRSRSKRRSRVLVTIVGIYAVLRVVLTLVNGGGAGPIVFSLVILALVAFAARRGRVSWVSAAVPALARLIGRLVSWRGITGQLARENVIRQPGRTAVTAAALMIGLALVTFASILAVGLKDSINQAIDSSFAGNLIVENSQSTSGNGIPASIAPALRRVPGVATVTEIAFSEGKVRGVSGNSSVTAIDPATFAKVYRVDWEHGSTATLATLGTTGTVLTRSFADKYHLTVGKKLSVLTPSDRRITLTVRGIATDNARLLSSLTITLPLARTLFAQRDDALDFVNYAPGAANARVQPAVDRLLTTRYPQAQSRTAAQFKQDEAGQINGLLTLIYVLLALSVLVSLFGIVNTLVLSIYERTRELGMLRAIGTSRRQIRQMIRYESVITALIGGVLGVILGIVIALVSTASLDKQGFVFSIPVVTLLVLLVLAGIAGVGASVWPARRAARVDLLEALATE